MITKEKLALKTELDELSKKYETKDFIKDDPVQFIHIFKDKKDIETAGFISALFAFGKREVFIKKLNELFNLTEMHPYDFVLNFDPRAYKSDFNYRFIKPGDLVSFFLALKKLYAADKMTLEELFASGFNGDGGVFDAIQTVCDYFYKNTPQIGDGYKFMLSNPKNKGAMKRINMFLRWMVRKNSPVDIGIWDFIKPSELFIPLDVHVGNISRDLGLLKRKQNDNKAVFELTSKLREFDPDDPVKYDFALFGYGVNRGK